MPSTFSVINCPKDSTFLLDRSTYMSVVRLSSHIVIFLDGNHPLALSSCFLLPHIETMQGAQYLPDNAEDRSFISFLCFPGCKCHFCGFVHPGFVAPRLYGCFLAIAPPSEPVLGAVLHPQGPLATSPADTFCLKTEGLCPNRPFVGSAPCKILKKAFKLVRSALGDQNCYSCLMMLHTTVCRCYGASSGRCGRTSLLPHNK